MGQKLDETEDFLYGFKKFIAFLLILIVGVIFRVKGMIDGGNFTDLMKACYIAFAAANGLEHWSNTATNYIKNNQNALINQVKKDL